MWQMAKNKSTFRTRLFRVFLVVLLSFFDDYTVYEVIYPMWSLKFPRGSQNPRKTRLFFAICHVEEVGKIPVGKVRHIKVGKKYHFCLYFLSRISESYANITAKSAVSGRFEWHAICYLRKTTFLFLPIFSRAMPYRCAIRGNKAKLFHSRSVFTQFSNNVWLFKMSFLSQLAESLLSPKSLGIRGPNPSRYQARYTVRKYLLCFPFQFEVQYQILFFEKNQTSQTPGRIKKVSESIRLCNILLSRAGA